jgi:DNA-binding MarR family transcriptional regulator
MDEGITAKDYEALAEFRRRIRLFLKFSEQAVRRTGLEPKQHQLLLALKGLPSNVRPRIAELASRMQIRHHSAVELANRLQEAGFVRRKPGKEDRREVLLQLTARGEKVLRELSLHHGEELRSQGPELLESLRALLQYESGKGK